MTTKRESHLRLGPRTGKEYSYKGYQENWWNVNTGHGLNNGVVFSVKLHDFDRQTVVKSECLSKYTLQYLGEKKYGIAPVYLK